MTASPPRGPQGEAATIALLDRREVTLTSVSSAHRPVDGGEGGPDSGLPVVFVSYSREDAEWLRRVVTMLKPLVRARRCRSSGSDTIIGTGEQWGPQIEDAIARADIALLLVSPDFLGSEFIMDRELPALIGTGVPLGARSIARLPLRHGRRARAGAVGARPEPRRADRSRARH